MGTAPNHHRDRAGDDKEQPGQCAAGMSALIFASNWTAAQVGVANGRFGGSAFRPGRLRWSFDPQGASSGRRTRHHFTS
jgi:hypothetical protein